MTSPAERPIASEPSMYFEYLRRIEHAVFPLAVTDPDEMTNVESLRLVGMVTICDESTCVDEDRLTYQMVVIHEITLLGRTELRRRQKQGPWNWRERRER